MDEVFYLYEYDEQGYHNGKVTMNSLGLKVAFQTIVKTAMDEGRKIIITDAADMCVFHMEDGKVIFPKTEN